MTWLLLLWNDFRNGDENLDCEQSDAILIIASKMLKKWNHLINHCGHWDFLHKLGQVVRGLSSDHGCFIMNEEAELRPKSLLRRRRGFFVRGGV